jgi:catechol 2,3-dioxygenase-like lactoylglutathione lyase family enzyme
MITGIDHIGIYVRDLPLAVSGFEAMLGRRTNWRGSFGDHDHAWFQLPNVALDVIAPVGDTESAQKTRAYIDKHGEGIWGIGFATPDLDKTAETLSRRGLDMLPIFETRSRATNGEERPWRIAMSRRASTGGLTQFFVEQKSRWPVAPITGEEDAAVAALDHVVVNTENPDRALALYGAKLGLDLRLDRSNEQWGSRLLFFRCGDAVVEIGTKLNAPAGTAPDRFGGLAWRIKDAAAIHARHTTAGLNVSELRKGRKPGTHVFTVRAAPATIPTLMLEPSTGD